MSELVEKIDNVKQAIKSLVESFDTTKLTVSDVRHLFKLMDTSSNTATKLETIILNIQNGQLAAKAIGVRSYQVDEYVYSSTKPQYTRPIPHELTEYDPDIDELISEAIICKQLKITYPTLARWRRNWRSETNIAFPPPLIYVYKTPRWSMRQLSWWIESNDGIAYIKGKKDELKHTKNLQAVSA